MPLNWLNTLAQFGVAGLMGVLWVWERAYSRRREQQLSQAHARLMQQREELHALIDIVERNTAALERFDQTQSQLIHVLERMENELRHRAA